MESNLTVGKNETAAARMERGSGSETEVSGKQSGDSCSFQTRRSICLHQLALLPLVGSSYAHHTITDSDSSRSVIFVRREYIALLPVAQREPRGPIDPPFYSEEAPPGWWRENTDELFGAAAQISYIMRDLNSLAIFLHTPFTGLCVFTAALVSIPTLLSPHIVFRRVLHLLIKKCRAFIPRD